MAKLIVKKSECLPEPERPYRPDRQKNAKLTGGLYFFEDRLNVQGLLTAKVITCHHWLLEILELESGEAFFLNGTEKIYPKTKCFGIFYPPFSITRLCFVNVWGTVKGFAGEAELPAEISNKPMVFAADFSRVTENEEQILTLLLSNRHGQSVESNPQASLLSVKTKKLIDRNYHINLSISRIASRLNVSHEHLARQFKRDFEMTPSAYMHQLRIADATFRLAQGEAIIDVSGDVGYNDLSCFYKQFRKSNRKAPGVCRSAIKARSAG